MPLGTLRVPSNAAVAVALLALSRSQPCTIDPTCALQACHRRHCAWMTRAATSRLNCSKASSVSPACEILKLRMERRCGLGPEGCAADGPPSALPGLSVPPARSAYALLMATRAGLVGRTRWPANLQASGWRHALSLGLRLPLDNVHHMVLVAYQHTTAVPSSKMVPYPRLRCQLFHKGAPDAAGRVTGRGLVHATDVIFVVVAGTVRRSSAAPGVHPLCAGPSAVAVCRVSRAVGSWPTNRWGCPGVVIIKRGVT